MIITFEGLDCSGKTTLAREVAERLNLTFFDEDKFKNEYHDMFFKNEVYYTGGNVVLCHMYKNFDNFVKTRFQLTEYVYTRYFNRKSGIPFEKMDECGRSKNFVVFVDIDFEDYLKYSKSRIDEKKFTKDEFEQQRTLFFEAFMSSRCKKMVLKNKKLEATIEAICEAA